MQNRKVSLACPPLKLLTDQSVLLDESRDEESKSSSSIDRMFSEYNSIVKVKAKQNRSILASARE